MPTFALGILFVLATLFQQVLAAATPPGFKPIVHRVIQVHYGNFRANPPGKAMRAGHTSKAPNLGIQEPDPSAGYTAVILDIDVQTSESPKNTSRLHWVQTELKTENKTKPSLDTNVPPVVPYYPPGPPKDETHTFVVLIYKQPSGWTVPSEYVEIFAKAAENLATRIDFDLEKFTKAAKFDSPAAADYFLVSTYSHPRSSKEAGTTPTPVSTASPAPTQKSGAADRRVTAWVMTCMICASWLGFVWAS